MNIKFICCCDKKVTSKQIEKILLEGRLHNVALETVAEAISSLIVDARPPEPEKMYDHSKLAENIFVQDYCHCGKDGHPLNSINCPAHGCFDKNCKHCRPAEPEKRWKPEEGQKYWYFTGDGEILNEYFRDDKIDNDRWRLGNCFVISQKAEQARERIKQTLMQFHEER